LKEVISKTYSHIHSFYVLRIIDIVRGNVKTLFAVRLRSVLNCPVCITY